MSAAQTFSLESERICEREKNKCKVMVNVHMVFVLERRSTTKHLEPKEKQKRRNVPVEFGLGLLLYGSIA